MVDFILSVPDIFIPKHPPSLSYPFRHHETIFGFETAIHYGHRLDLLDNASSKGHLAALEPNRSPSFHHEEEGD